MVNYGSTVRLAILPRDSNEPLYDIPVILADTNAAHNTIRQSVDKLKDWLYVKATTLKKFQDVTDEQIIELAKARGLSLEIPRIVFPDLYYVPSRSGNTSGHYIERNGNIVSCTCPGFTNRGYCWASNQILSSLLQDSKWVDNRENFYAYRKHDYGV